MLVRVIYKDQTAGVVERHLLDKLIKKGRVVAYHRDDRWISVENESFVGECAMSAVRPDFVETDRRDAN